MSQITIIKSLVGINPNDTETSCHIGCNWDTLNTLTNEVVSGNVEVLILEDDTASECEDKIRDAVAAHMYQQSGIVMDNSQCFQHALKRG